jgi:ferredoxin
MSETPTPAPRKIARVEIDRELCIGAASCIAVAPEGFELDGENKAVTKPAWHELTDEQLLNAAKSCPVAAIYLYDEAGQRIYPE